MSRRTPYTAFRGGLDLVTPAIQMPDGTMIAGVNFEPWINGGYRRLQGFERFDGRPSPSDAQYDRLKVNDTSVFALGATVTGDISGATGKVVVIDPDSLTVVVTKVVGTFQEEPVDAAAALITDVTRNGSDDVAQFGQWRYAAEQDYRADILQVPGENPIRGVHQVRDRVYAIRDSVGGAQGVIYKATAAGWNAVAITYTHTVRFITGAEAFDVGDVVEGSVSSAQGTVHRVVVLSGSYGGGDATGYLVLTSVTGTFQDAENLDVGVTTKAVANGASSQFQLPPGGRYDFNAANFLAGSNTYRLYAAGGVGPAFEIDENDIVSPILLDLSLGDSPTENNPFLVQEFDGRLWLMFPGGSLQRSVTGAPLQFNGFLGAAEFGLGEEGTGLIATAGKALVAYTRGQIFGFFPATLAGEYEKRSISDRAGAVLHSVERLSTMYSVDDTGIVDIQRADRFGDFADATISDLIQPFVVANVNNIAGVMTIKESSQYRILLKNGNAIAARIWADGRAEYGLLNLRRNITCAYTCGDETTTPSYWFAGDDGYVYQAERGRNFDGDEIESVIRLNFTHLGSPALRKRFRLADLELQAARDVMLYMAYELDYASPDNVGTARWEDRVIGGGGLYDVDNYDEIYYDSQIYSTARFELLGSGQNISMMFYNRSAVTEPFILQGITLHFDPRRTRR